MTPERHQHVMQVLETALELDPADRLAGLEELCDGDPDLRREVESLLGFDGDRSGDLLDEPLFQLRAEVSPGAAPGSRIGPYLIERELDHGGMGTVYLAEREEPYRQRVALKIIHRGLLSHEVARRFDVERQVLARLEHPNVARILDGGTTAEGLPYFAMEYVEGERIDRYCERHELPISERLELFLAVCSALSEAHQHLVVHRDLKPANILVTDDGVPKLLDFGIAKPLGPELARDAATTELESGPMTMRYASPEQIQGRTITTASDVYSLGVLLYELLTGRYPYPIEDRDRLEVMQAICSEEPPRPSTVVRRATGAEVPAAFGSRPHRRLAGDLDSIVLKALAKEPRQRYGSVEQLAEDVRRYLEGLPVSAREGTLFYRARKFVRRHRLALAGAGAVTLLLVASLLAWRQAELQRLEAARNAERAFDVVEFLEDLFDAIGPDRAGEAGSARELLDLARQRLESESELEEDPEFRASLLGRLGMVYQGMGDSATALDLIDESLTLRRAHFRGDHSAIATSLANRALCFYDLGSYERAILDFREGIEMKRRLGEDDEDLLMAEGNLGGLLLTRGDFQGAEPLLREALAKTRALYGPDHPATGRMVRNLGALYLAANQPTRALEHFAEALRIYRRAHGAEHTRIAMALNDLGRTRQVLGDLAEAERLLEEALAMRLRLQEDHPNVARTRRDLAAVRLARGEHAAAAELIDQALAALRDLKREGDWEIADAESLRCGLWAAEGRFREAEPCLLSSLETLETARGERSIYAREALERVVGLYRAWGKADEAARHARRLDEIENKVTVAFSDPPDAPGSPR